MNLKKTSKQFFQYLIVGGIATIVEWIAFYFLNEKLQFHYLLATSLAFVVSTFANWLVGKIILFKEWKNIIGELVKVYLTSIAGLIFNLIIMWFAVEKLGMYEMLGKILATGIVFIWNFLIRKLVIYKI